MDRTFRSRPTIPVRRKARHRFKQGGVGMSIGNLCEPPPPWPLIHAEGRIVAELALLIPVAMLALLVALAALLRS